MCICIYKKKVIKCDLWEVINNNLKYLIEQLDVLEIERVEREHKGGEK